MAHLELGRVAVTAHRLAKEREAHTHTHVFCAPPDAAGAGAEEGKRNSACTLLQRTGTRGFKGGLLPPRLGPSHRAKERRASLPAAERHGKLAIRGAATCAALAARPLHAACGKRHRTRAYLTCLNSTTNGYTYKQGLWRSLARVGLTISVLPRPRQGVAIPGYS